MKLTFMTIAHEGERQSEVFLSCHTHTRTHGQQQQPYKNKAPQRLILGSNDNITNKGGNLNHNQDRISARYFVQHVGYVDFKNVIEKSFEGNKIVT